MNNRIYSMLINGLCLASAPYEVQINFLPKFVQHADEVVNAVEYTYVPQLIREGLITDDQGKSFKAYETYLESYAMETEYADISSKEQLRIDPWFEQLRKEAKILLNSLNQPYIEPNQSNVTYVKGA